MSNDGTLTMRRLIETVTMLGEADDTHSPLSSDQDSDHRPDMEEPDYMSGRCHVFAIGLHRAKGFSFLLLTDKSERYKGGVPAVHHVYAVDKTGGAYDCRGRHDAAEIVANWMHVSSESWHRPGVIRIATEKGLKRFLAKDADDWERPLDIYSDADVQVAQKAAERILP